LSPNQWPRWDDEWPYEWPYDWPDEPLEPLPDDLPSVPVPLVGYLVDPCGVVLARHEFVKPLTLNNGDVLSLKYSLGIEGEEMALEGVEAKLIRAADIPAE
jgi:hypothetical protein